MIKHLQKIGNSKGIVIDKPILELLKVDENGAFEITQKKGGLFLKPVHKRESHTKNGKQKKLYYNEYSR